MRRFDNLLYISQGIDDETEGLKQAISLARNNKASLKILVIRPEFPSDFPEYKTKFEEFLISQIETSIDKTLDAIKVEKDTVDISLELLKEKTPLITIVQYMEQHERVLVIKEAKPRDDNSGFKALDMDLLRKCPAPVWLCRPIENSRQDIKVAVAIDPKSQEQAAEQLSIRLLKLAREMADSCSGELQILSCWDYAMETELKNNVFVKIPAEQIQAKVDKARSGHYAVLQALIEKSGIAGNNQIHHLRGKADQAIPEFVDNEHIDILVMGTVARTGIAGVIFGNTAENIIQQLSCSLLALKPNGFVSPVKA